MIKQSLCKMTPKKEPKISSGMKSPPPEVRTTRMQKFILRLRLTTPELYEPFKCDFNFRTKLEATPACLHVYSPSAVKDLSFVVGK